MEHFNLFSTLDRDQRNARGAQAVGQQNPFVPVPQMPDNTPLVYVDTDGKLKKKMLWDIGQWDVAVWG